MELLEKLLDILALIVQLIGALMMYKNSPINTLQYPTQMGGVTDVKTYKIKNRWLERGLLILVIGFAIGLFSLLMKDFVPSNI